MMCGGVVGLISKVTWFVTGVVALNIGLAAFGITALDYSKFVANPQLKTYIDYLVGASGAVSLFYFFQRAVACVSGTCHCCNDK